MSRSVPTERAISALNAELETIYEIVEKTALTASTEDQATLYRRSRELVAEIGRLKRGALV